MGSQMLNRGTTRSQKATNEPVTVTNMSVDH